MAKNDRQIKESAREGTVPRAVVRAYMENLAHASCEAGGAGRSDSGHCKGATRSARSKPARKLDAFDNGESSSNGVRESLEKERACEEDNPACVNDGH